MPVIPATQDAEVGRMAVQDWEKVDQTPISTNKLGSVGTHLYFQLCRRYG
jgi:hypothetical protein